MKQPAVSVISLGCSKNLVDTECMLGAFVERGWLIAANHKNADVLLINTCGFIGDAREESLAYISEALKLKEHGIVRAVVVVGCVVQLMRGKLPAQFPDIDGWVGVAEPGVVVDACVRALDKNEQTACWFPDPAVRKMDATPRLRATPRHFAYLRIAEGCDNNCRYCLIPRIRGPLRSKPLDKILSEANELVADGARELIIIAQDTTNYGRDLFGKSKLPHLLEQLTACDALWIRLLYAHPAHFDDTLIATLAQNEKLLPYIDLPIQHVSDRILESMGRGITQDGIRALISRIRAKIPAAVLRTSIIVGYPGETEEDFDELMSFIEETRFERLGAFAYSREDGTPAGSLQEQVPDAVKEERLAALMELQQQIVAEQGEELMGTEIDVVVDGRGPDGEIAGRTTRDAPDVDGALKFENASLVAGTFGRAVVTDAYGYDLTARMISTKYVPEE